MWNFLKGLLASTPKAVAMPDEPTDLVTIRFGKAVTPDEAFFSRFTGDVPRMVAALEVDTNPIDRHFLLLNLVQETYKRRAQADMAALCAETAELHLREFPSLVGPLLQDLGVLPRVPTFQHYATLLTEHGEFEKAIHVCETALSYGLHDGTKSGFEGRIRRIQKRNREAQKT